MNTKCSFSLFFLSVFFDSFLSKHVEFTDCGKKEIKWINIDPCDSSPCTLTSDVMYELSVQLEPTQNSDTVLFAGDVTYPDSRSFPLPNLDMCQEQSDLCPLKRNVVSTAVYKALLPMFIPKSNNVNAKLQFIGDDEAVLCCANITVNLA